MKTIFEHIEHVKGKPHHVRKRVAFAAAASLTAFIALVWFVGNLSLGVFAIPSNSFADSVARQNALTSDTGTDSPNLAGVAGVIPKTSGPARIEIIDAASSTTGQKKAEQTVIPF